MQVDQNLSKRIKLSHWNLDPKLATDGISKELTLNVEETAILLSDAIGSKISHKNVIELCLMRFARSFGAYLNSDLYNIKIVSEPRTAYDATKISQAIFFDGDYKYNVPGLVRLIKHFDPKIGLKGQTLEHLSNTSKIVLTNESRLPLQQSISNHIFGVSQSIQCIDSNPLIIDFSNLVFIKHEVMDFISCNIDELNKIFRSKIADKSSNVRLMTRPQIKKVYTNIPARTWDYYLNQKNKNCIPLAIKGANARHDQFSVDDTHQWLIANNKYTPEELEKHTINI